VREKRICRTAAEVDVHSRARRLYIYTGRPGVCADVKRRTNRRERFDARRELHRDYVRGEL
jgi:hypothetical protein